MTHSSDGKWRDLRNLGLVAALTCLTSLACSSSHSDDSHVRVSVEPLTATLGPFAFVLPGEAVGIGPPGGAGNPALALIGSPHTTVAGKANQGEVTQIETIASRLTQWLHLTTTVTVADGAAGDLFGTSVAMSQGNFLSGAPGANAGRGAAYYSLAFSSASPTKLVANDGVSGDAFGQVVVLDGTTAFVGAPKKTVNAKANAGAVYVFTLSGMVWTQQAEILAPSDSPPTFGSALSASDNRIAIGASAGIMGGAAYVYALNGASWVQEAAFLVSYPTVDFGTAVALEGTTLLVGDPEYILGNQEHDSWVGVYVRTVAGSTPQGSISSPVASVTFGSTLALSGTTALIGGSEVYIFARSGQKDTDLSQWTMAGQLQPSDSGSTNFGRSVSLATQGGIGAALVGSSTEAYQFQFSGLAGTACTVATDCAAAYACVGGVCCTSSCAGACETCLAASGASSDGVCTLLTKGKPGSPACAGNVVCDGTSPACPANCTSDASCSSGSFCTSGGTCAPTLATGATCSAASCKDPNNCKLCATGNCVDGFCCDAACDAGCDVCAKASGASANGTCTILSKGAVGVGCAGYLCNGVSASCPTGGCSSNSDCASGDYCAGGQCLAQKTQGAACASSSECLALNTNQVGYCVDGFCCGSPCTGKCTACAAAKKTSGIDGECGDSALGTDPHDDCTQSDKTTCGQTGQCDGNGVCQLYPQGTTCGLTFCVMGSVSGQVCDGLGTCGNTTSPLACAPYQCVNDACTSPCKSTDDCAMGYYCIGGTCAKQHSPGTGCTTADQCGSTFCVDGVCCDAPCTGQCEACALTGKVGTCSPVTGTPIAPRLDCKGTEPCKGDCNGAYTTACTYPNQGTSCGAASCTGDVTQPAAFCDGNGTCTMPTTKNCAPYVCDRTTGACRPNCTTQADCAAGAQCDTGSGKCAVTANTCKDSFSVLTPSGTESSCGAYKCVAGACQQQCAQSSDCAPGHVCQSSSCVAAGDGSTTLSGDAGSADGETAVTQQSGCGCSVPGHTDRGRGALTAFFLAGALSRLRWRRRSFPSARSRGHDDSPPQHPIPRAQK